MSMTRNEIIASVEDVFAKNGIPFSKADEGGFEVVFNLKPGTYIDSAMEAAVREINEVQDAWLNDDDVVSIVVYEGLDDRRPDPTARPQTEAEKEAARKLLPKLNPNAAWPFPK